jgi:flavorubredoxin
VLVKALRPRVKLAAFFGSFGWGGGAARQATEILGPAGFELIGALDIKGTPADKDLEAAAELGKKVAQRIKG